MDADDIRILAGEIGPMMRDFVGASLKPIAKRLDLVERRFAQLPVSTNGKDADPDVTASIVIFRLKPEIEEIRAAIAGQPEKIEADIARAIAAIPIPKDGASGQDGKSVTAEDIAPIIAAEVAALPKPKDGAPGINGKDGLALASALIDREGNLILTASDGSTKELGRIVGKDGIDGAAGKSTEPDSLLAPDDIATRIADAVKMMAETVSAVQPAEAGERQLPVSIFLPGVDNPETVVKVALPPQQAPVVNIPAPIINIAHSKSRKVTNVQHNERGQIVRTITEEE